MEKIKKQGPTTLVKVATSYDDLEAIVNRFSQEMIPIESIHGNTKQYHLYEEKPEHYMIIISQQIEKKLNIGSYNILLTITSESQELNEKLYKDFEQKANLEFKEAPQDLQITMQGLNLSFLAFKNFGKEKVLSILRSRESIK